MTVTAPRPRQIVGWSDEEFQALIDEVLTRGDVKITDISSPPGTRKTFYTLKYAVERRQSLIASFPTHTNQATALDYIANHMEREEPRRLPMYVLDYAGVEKYCLLMRPALLKRLLDKYRKEGETYEKAVENFLGDPVVTSILVSRGLDVDELWYELGRALDEYEQTRDTRRYRARVRELVEKRGQREVCQGACPVGLFFWLYRRQVYRDLSDPKLITWRRDKAEELKRKYPHVGKHIVLANPDLHVEHHEELKRGKYRLEAVLCPRLLLVAKAALGGSGRPNYIAVRRSIILTPHAGLDFVLSEVTRAHRVQKLEPRHKLFIDEYDALMKPRRLPVLSLHALAALAGVAHEVLEAGVGGEVRGVHIDEYLHRYARYAYDLAMEAHNIARAALEAGEYHPILNLFAEGAMASLEERRLKAQVKIPPLSPRYVHIKHFAGSRLLPLILNEDAYFRDLAAVDPEWRANLRAAKQAFSRLARVPVRERHVVAEGSSFKLVWRTVRRNVDIIPLLREYLRPLLYTPRYAVYYEYSGGRLHLASLDTVLHTLLRLRGAILTSASPVHWHLYGKGPYDGFVNADYNSLVSGIVLSLVSIAPPEPFEYSDRREREYTISYYAYREEDLERLRDSIENHEPTPEIRRFTVETGVIRQVAVHTTAIVQYAGLLRTVYPPSLPSLYVPEGPVPRERARLVVERVTESIRPYLFILSIIPRGYTLVLTQNKLYARILAAALGGRPCHGENCDNPRTVTHYQAGRITITWFRSRAGRGIDLPHDYTHVLVVGSPYPRPTTLVPGEVPSSPLTTAVSTANRYTATAYNTGRRYTLTLAHTPRDIMAAIAELTQAIGRATRAAMRTGTSVIVILPGFLRAKVEAYAPPWLHGS